MKWVVVVVAAAVGPLAGCNRPAPAPRADQASAPHAATAAAPSQVTADATLLQQLEAMHFEADRTHAGEPLPSARLTRADGRPTDLASLRGRPVLVNMWARWCAPCRAEMPTLNRLASARAGSLQVVAINEDGVHAGRPSLGELDISPPIISLSDPSGELSKRLAGAGLPTTILYGPDGRERWRLTGVLNWTKEQAVQLLAEGERPAQRVQAPG